MPRKNEQTIIVDGNQNKVSQSYGGTAAIVAILIAFITAAATLGQPIVSYFFDVKKQDNNNVSNTQNIQTEKANKGSLSTKAIVPNNNQIATPLIQKNNK